MVGDSTQSRLVNTLHGALIGSGIGAAAGLLYALVEVGSIKKNSDDGEGYVVAIALGAFIGYIVGGVVGFLHS